MRCVRVAQLDRALGYGPRCREFESSHARYEKPQDSLFGGAEVFYFANEETYDAVHWLGHRNAPPYVLRLLSYYVEMQHKLNENGISEK